MNDIADSSTLSLIMVNAILGIFCLAVAIAVAIAAILDLAERRRIRASLPKGWPPDEPPARVIALPKSSIRREGSRVR